MADGEAGSATVEIALLLPLVVLLIVALAEIAVVGKVQIELINGAREGARVAAVNPEPADAVATVNEVLGPRRENARISVTRPLVVGEPAIVRIVLRHRLVPFLWGGVSVDLIASAAMRVER